MSPGDIRESAPRQESAFQNTGSATDRLHGSRRAPSQKERVRRALTRGWTCGVEFLNPTDGWPPILRYSSRISELRADGFYVDRRVCENRLHGHPHSTMWQWKIVGHANDGTLPGIDGGP